VSESDEASVQEESGTETTDADLLAESSSESTHLTSSPPDTPLASKVSKASHAAASRGLNVTVTNPDRGNRHSKIMGLPHSPRPPHSPNKHAEP
jgi:RalA-binding protein 1